MFECRHAPFAVPTALADELTAAYGAPQRAYHNLSHITALLRWFDRVADEHGPWQAPASVYTAILFHDAVYVAGAKDNERESARWAARAITEHALPALSDLVVAIILATADHMTLAGASGDTALFLDSDMSILGTPPDVYARYATAVRQEYAAVPEAAYRAGRGQFLRAVLAKPRIFFSDYFHALLDAQARVNLAAELASLG
jgi:predicted metal-dependent HD superfamily phosphohydrolase